MAGIIIIPDRLRNIPPKYWKVIGDSVIEMTTEEKAEVDINPEEPIIETRIKSIEDRLTALERPVL